MKSQLVKWGNSLAVRIPKTILEKAEMNERERIDVAVHEKGVITIRKTEPKMTLDSLVEKITRKNLHKETVWGPRVGKEIW